MSTFKIKKLKLVLFLSLIVVLFFLLLPQTKAQSVDPYWIEYKEFSTNVHKIGGPFTSEGACHTWWTENTGIPGQTPIGSLVKDCFISAQTPTVTPEPGIGNTDTNYKLLAPLPDGSGGTLSEFESDPQKNPCPLGKYLNIIIKLFFGIAGVLAVVMIVWGGVQYMTTELVSSKEEGKKSIRNAIFGLVLALSAYLILNTINPELLNACLNNVTPVEYVVSEDTPQTPIDNKYCNGAYVNGTDWTGTPASLPQGVTVSPAGDCSKVGQQNCTSTKDLKLNIVNTIKSKCPNCELKITGGTECWLHSATGSHKKNSPTIDLSAGSSPNLNMYITGGKNKKGENIGNSFPNDGQQYPKDGVIYLAEVAGQTGNTTNKHWHASGQGNGNQNQGEVYASVSWTGSSKTIMITINNYDSNKNHKVMISNNGNNISKYNLTSLGNGLLPITLSQIEYDQVKGATPANVSVWSAGIGIGTKSLLIN